MVKSRADNEEASKAQASLIVGNFNGSSLAFWRNLSHRQRVICVSIVLSALVIGLAVWQFTRPNIKREHINNEAQVVGTIVKNLSDNPPAKNASVDTKVTYYNKLMRFDAQTKDYKGAIAAFLQRQSVRSSDLTYQDYILLASYYHEAGNKSGALSALNKADTVVPSQPDDTGSDPTVAHTRISQLKEIYAK